MLRKITACGAVALLCLLVFSGQAFAQSSTAIIALTNQQRAAAGFKPLAENEKLMASALAKAQDMLQRNYWAHYAPDNTSPWDFIRATGYVYVYAGENLAQGYADDQSVVNAWMQSPEHRKNILDPTFQDIGVAVIDGRLMGHRAKSEAKRS